MDSNQIKGEPVGITRIGEKLFFWQDDGGEVYDHWDIHYSRVIENQLDLVHLPFVYHNTIGRGGRTLVDGPLVEWLEEDNFFIYVFNRLDDGTPPCKPSELSKPGVGGRKYC